jgi:DNA-binding XRE family transcriptional regulator
MYSFVYMVLHLYYLMVYIDSMTGAEFKGLREKMRLSQKDLAERLGVTETTIYRWETEKAPISKAVELAIKQVRAELREEDLRD